MTSNISFSKLVIENILRRGWLFALSFLMLFVGEVIPTAIHLEEQLSYADETGTTLAILQAEFPNIVSGNSVSFLVILIPLLGILIGATGLSFLHSTEKTDFFHSLPISRKKIFSVIYVSGLIIFVLPYIVSSACTLIVGGMYGVVTGQIFLRCLPPVLGGILGFLIFYHTTLLGMILTGNLVTGILGTFVLTVYGTVGSFLILAMADYFFATWFSATGNILEKISLYSSPGSLYVATLTSFVDGWFLSPLTIILPLFLVLSVALVWFLYLHRSSEAASQALAFPKTAPFLKVAISIPVSLAAGLLLTSTYSLEHREIWMFLFVLFAALLTCCIIEFIYHTDLKLIFSGKYSSLISVFGAVAILAIMHFDIFGYDTWIPDENKIESISWETNSLYNYFSYPTPEGKASLGQPDLLYDEAGKIKNFKPLYTLAKEGLDNLEKDICPNTLYENGLDGEYTPITLRYHLSNGKSRFRRYAVSYETAYHAFAELCTDEAYREFILPAFYLDGKQIQTVTATDVYYQPETLSLSGKEISELLELYKRDLMNASLSEMHTKFPIGELSFSSPERPMEEIAGDELSAIDKVYLSRSYSSSNMHVESFYVYDSYVNTIKFLEDYGYTFRKEIKPEDILSISLVTEDDYRQITDIKEQKDFLSRVTFRIPKLFEKDLYYNESVEIVFDWQDGPITYGLTK